MSTLIGLAGMLIAVAFQTRMPTLWWLGGVRLEFLPALVAYAAFTMHSGRALALAIAAGLLQDALSAGHFGISALAYGVAAMMIVDLREAFDRDLPWVQLAAGAMTSALVAILAFLTIGVSIGAIFKMCVVAFISGIITMLVFFVLDYSRMVWESA